LALDFVGARRGPQYYKSGGVTTADITKIPGWTYTGGTPAGTGSYAPKADGSLQFFPSVTNLLLQSQTFDNASWVKTSSSVSANADTAPDGTATADLWTRSATVAYFAQGVSKGAFATTYTQSVYVKRSVGNFFALRMQGTYPARADVVFNLSTGAISSSATAYSGFASASATIAPAANGFYLVTLTATTDAVASVTGFYSFNSNGVVVDGTDSVSNSAGYIWGAQLELGSTASTYIPTTTAAVTVAPPRITDAGYLAEESRTNLLLRSQEFDNASWVKTRATVSADATTAPNGTLTADALIEDTSSSTSHFMTQQVSKAASSTTYALSFYAKQNGRTRVQAQISNIAQSGGAVVVFDLAGGQIGVAPTTYGTGFTVTSGLIESAGNGWYRCTVIGTTDTATNVTAFLLLDGGSGTSAQVQNYTGNGTSGLYFWQADLQAGAFATSPIPTTSVAVTRAADVGSIAGVNLPFYATLSARYSYPPLSSARQQLVGVIDSGLNRLMIRARDASLSSSTAVLGNGSVNGTASLVSSGTTGATTNVAIAWVPEGAGNLSVSANGLAPVQADPAVGAVSGTVGVKTLSIGHDGSGTFSANAPIRRIVIYPRAMSNAELQAVTTAGAY
jgi:hypothetical protein